MKRIATFVALGVLALECSAQVFRAEPEHPQRSPSPSTSGAINTPPAAQKAPFTVQRERNPCRNFDRELRALERRSAAAKSTGERDQFDLQYQRLLESKSRAGC